ncbi:MAG TPA: 5-oxoprolinase subunit PxpA [Anaeromyxobacteraceae bacterium]|nr:5-oxoprolinase subunit PxpA [Anaeromyxobacteraceae bacterium]
MAVDLNCDLGEEAGEDERILPLVSSVNVACGFHAGDASTIRATVRLAARHGVAVGAHPSYPDRAGFGRAPMDRTPAQVRDDVVYQVAAVRAFCAAEGVPLVHVKPHGALYNAAAQDRALATAIGEAVREVDPGLVVVCLAGSPMASVVRSLGLRCAEEAFADRGYTPQGTLVPRGTPGALLEDPAAVAERVSAMARERRVRSVTGAMVAVAADTICLHGDTPGAAALAAAIRARLAADGVEVRPMRRG